MAESSTPGALAIDIFLLFSSSLRGSFSVSTASDFFGDLDDRVLSFTPKSLFKLDPYVLRVNLGGFNFLIEGCVGALVGIKFRFEPSGLSTYVFAGTFRVLCGSVGPCLPPHVPHNLPALLWKYLSNIPLFTVDGLVFNPYIAFKFGSFKGVI